MRIIYWMLRINLLLSFKIMMIDVLFYMYLSVNCWVLEMDKDNIKYSIDDGLNLMVLDNFHTTILQDVGIEYDRGEARQFLERTAIELILTVKKICIRELLLGITTPIQHIAWNQIEQLHGIHSHWDERLPPPILNENNKNDVTHISEMIVAETIGLKRMLELFFKKKGTWISK